MNAVDSINLDTHDLTFVCNQTTEKNGKRECGTCDACYTVMAVGELAKTNYARCQHKGECGCTIYADRPESCRAWGCNWLLGLLGDDTCRRPDQLGLLFALELKRNKYLLTAYEVWDGAAKNGKAAYLLHKLGRKYPIALVYTSNYFEVLSPDEEQREMLTALILSQARTEA